MKRSFFQRPRPRHASPRPRLEALEHRTAPAVFTVTNTADGGPGSLRQSVLDANAAVGADRITFDPAVFPTARTVQMTGGALTITDPVTIDGPAAGLTLDAGGLSGHFMVLMTNPFDRVSISGLTLLHAGGPDREASVANRNASLSLSNMVIADGMSGGISVGGFWPVWGWGFGWGWGYFSISGRLSLTDSTVSGNSSCGIDIINGEGEITRAVISGNSGDFGGGISVGSGIYGVLVLTDSTVSGNTSTYGGGGINMRYGRATVIHSTISGNVAGFAGQDYSGGGGGINVDHGTLAIVRSTISGNAADVGGGISFSNRYLPHAFTMDESTVSRNKATTTGGGMSITHSDAVIRNCTISGNVAGASASSRGGGIALSFSSLSLQNSTVAFNSAGSGFGGGIDNNKSGVDLRNVILSNNSAQNGGPDLNGEGRLDYCLVSNTSGAFITGGNNLLDIEARLGPLADNGGPTRTHRPGPGSPVRNTGGETTGQASDQRGQGFARVLQGRPDMGALESIDPSPMAVATVPNVITARGTVYVILVTYSDDTAIQASSLGTGDLEVNGSGYGLSFSVTPTFVWADLNSNGTPRLATYVFTPPGGAWDPRDNGVYTVDFREDQVYDTDSPPRSVPYGAIGTFAVQIPATYFVDEPSDTYDGHIFAGHLSLREAVFLANLDPGTRDTIAFSSAAFNGPSTIALTSGEFKITGPVTIIGPPAGLTLDAGGRSRLFEIDVARPGDPVSISNLTLTNGSAQTGGAVRNIDATLSLSRMLVTKNVATGVGGGIAVTGGSLTLVDSTVSGNAGGGIFVGSGASLSITGSTVSGNSTARSGGGVFIDAGASLTMTNCTVSGNIVLRGSGGGLYLPSATTAVIRNSTIADNLALYGGGIYGGTITLQSTIVAQNIGSIGPDLWGRATATFSLIGNTSGVTFGPASTNNLLDRDPLLGPLADNGGPTRTHALLFGSPAINAGSNPANMTTDQRGAGFPRVFESAADIGAFEVQQSTVRSVIVNAEQPNLVQRSMVTSVTVTFGGLVTFAGPAASAFQLQRTGPGGTRGNVKLAVDLSGSTATQTVARLTFAGVLTEGANSLIDGNHTLTIFSDQVNGGLLGGDCVTSFCRLFGDVNGDKLVNGLDLTAFRTAFGASAADANYRSDLDLNGDGAINGQDLAAFRTRFGVMLP